MNIAKTIELTKKLKAGYEVNDEAVIDYISTAEQMVLTDIVRGREGAAEIINSYGDYDLSTNRETELFAPPPYDVLYAQYAATQIDLLAEDGDRYLNDMAVFRDTFTDLKRYWWQTHRQTKNYAFHV